MIVMIMQKAGGPSHLQSLCFGVRTQTSTYQLAGEPRPLHSTKAAQTCPQLPKSRCFALMALQMQALALLMLTIFPKYILPPEFVRQWNYTRTYMPTGLKIHCERKLLSNVILLIFVFRLTVLGLQDLLFVVIPWCLLNFAYWRTKCVWALAWTGVSPCRSMRVDN